MSTEPSNGAGGPVTLTPSARRGLVLFVIYLLLYGGFVALNAFAPLKMATPVDMLGGINVAVVYGMFLIAAAFGLAVLYMVLCRHDVEEAGK